MKILQIWQFLALFLILYWTVTGVVRYVRTVLREPGPLHKRLLSRKSIRHLDMILIALGILAFARFVGQVAFVHSEPKRAAFVSKVLYHVMSPQRGSMVSVVCEEKCDLEPRWRVDVPPALHFHKLSSDQFPYEHASRRVVGMPGEVVTILGGRVYIDGKLLVEPYVPSYADNGQRLSLQLGSHEFLVARDFRDSKTVDSPTTFLLVNQKQIQGRELFVFWPFHRFGFVKTPVYNLPNPPVLKIRLDKTMAHTLVYM